MKVHVFEISYYIQQVWVEGEEKTRGGVLFQPAVSVAAETQDAAIALLKKTTPEGVEATVSHVSNGAQDILIADPVNESSELVSLKESFAAMSDENEKLREANQGLEADLASASAKIAAKIADLEAQLNQKPQPQPAQPLTYGNS